MIKLLTLIGARPQIIKASAISRAIKNKFSQSIKETIVHTGQHYDNNMSGVFIKELNIPNPDHNLGVGSGMQGWQTARMIEGIENLILNEKPGYLLVYGDTNSTLAGAIAAAKIHVPVVHVEAGLRSFNRQMPEETNRILCDHASTLLFSPSRAGYDNLVNEGFKPGNSFPYTPDKPGIFHCGDIMYDNSLHFAKLANDSSTIIKKLGLVHNTFLLATVHRDHNTDKPENLSAIFNAFIEIAENTGMVIVIPLHPRARKKLEMPVHARLRDKIYSYKNIKIIGPVSFIDMIQLEQSARLIMTDSGGVQKEAYFFQKPCIILRPQTEWVEILDSGAAKLAGNDKNAIINSYNELMKQPDTSFPAIFGDGQAAEFICKIIIDNGKKG